MHSRALACDKTEDGRIKGGGGTRERRGCGSVAVTSSQSLELGSSLDAEQHDEQQRGREHPYHDDRIERLGLGWRVPVV